MTGQKSREAREAGVFVVRAGRRSALMKRPFHLPTTLNKGISQCVQWYGLHWHLETGDIPQSQWG